MFKNLSTYHHFDTIRRAVIVAACLVGIVSVIFALAIRPSLAARRSQQDKPSAGNYWQDVAESSIPNQGGRQIIPSLYRTLRLDLPALKKLLEAAPMEFTKAANEAPVEMTIPMPDGKFSRFKIVESPMMAPEFYGRDLSIRMSFIANELQIIYTDATNDPYTAAPGTATINAENQTNLDSVIGDGSYDIGHVVGISNGGLATRPSVCSTGSKAQGSTGGPSPVGDPFDVDFVAHEMGHQFGGQHTFNDGTNNSCGGGNRAATAAYEPGSGTTIMAYAGVCAAADLQRNSDAYFHIKSLEEILAYITTGGGSGCDTETATGNSGPVIPPSFSFSYSSPTGRPSG